MGLHDIRCYLHVATFCNLPCVYALFIGSFLMQDMLSSLHEFAFEGTKHAIRLSRDIPMFLATI